MEVGALRIGASPPAPRFNVVAKPNNWSRGVLRATLTANTGPLDDRAKAYSAYWSGFGAFLQDKHAPYKILNPAPHDYAYSFRISRSGFALAETAGFRDRKLGVEIYISHRAAKRAFDLLEVERDTIEGEFGGKLDWQRLNDKKGCRIAVVRTDLDPRDESQRAMQYDWFLEQMQRFSRVFGGRIRSLTLDDAVETDVGPAETEAAGG